MSLYLGIDGGGTATRAVLVDREGRVRGIGRAGPANFNNEGRETAVANIQRAAELAWQDSGKLPARAGAAFLGCAGIRTQGDITSLAPLLERTGIAPAAAITVANDLDNALAGGLAGEPGIALIAGTGSNCLGRTETGETFMCGGWGWLLDDAGAGFGLAMAALRTAIRSADGRNETTSLLPAVLRYFRVSDPEELLPLFYGGGFSPFHLAGFAPDVMRCARDGDAAAMKILREGARALAELTAAVQRRLGFSTGPEIVVLGGCARSGSPYQPLVEHEIGGACPGSILVNPRGTPLYGAALNVLRQAGLSRPGHLPIDPACHAEFHFR